MAKITVFDKPTIKMIREELEATLSLFNEEYGVVITLGGLTYSDGQFTARVTGRTLESAEAHEKNKAVKKTGLSDETFELLATGLGLPPKSRGRQFQFKNKTYTIINIKPMNTKYPVIMRREPDGKTFRGGVAWVLGMLQD